jgi:hypothetical protein
MSGTDAGGEQAAQPHASIGEGPWSLLAWAAVFLAVAGALQWYTAVPYDADTAYHVAVGRMIRAHGILHAFPWTPFSWLADHYADKELLFHLLFVPLASLDWMLAAKIVGTVCGAAALLSIYVVLRWERVRLAGLWALLPLAASGVFVFRFALVRPHLLSIALAILVLWAAARGRLVLLAVCSVAYPWAYVAWHLPIVLAGIAETTRLLSRERLRWKPIAVAAAGVALGVLTHPNAANLAQINWIHVADVLARNVWAGRIGFEMGREFEPYTALQAARYLVFIVLASGIAVVLAWRNRHRDSLPLTFAIAAVLFGALAVRSARFTEYFAPVATTALALSARWIPGREALSRWIPAVALGVAALYTGTAGALTIQGLATRDDDVPPALASFLREQIPEGAQVFTCEWGLTGSLMLALPERRFIVALDPTLFFRKDPELYRIWYELPRSPPPDAAEVIRQRFGARYVVCGPIGDRLYRQIAFEEGVRVLLVDDLWSVLDLGEPPGPSPGR